MSKCDMKVTGSDAATIEFTCVTGHTNHSIYVYAQSCPFKGVVKISRRLWASRMAGRRI